MRKKSKILGKSAGQRVCSFNDPATGYECQRSGWAPTNSGDGGDGGDGDGGDVCVLPHACARGRAHACVRDVCAIYDNNI